MACWDKEINTKSQSFFFFSINLPCGAILLMLHKRSKLVRVSSTESSGNIETSQLVTYWKAHTSVTSVNKYGYSVYQDYIMFKW